jgi:DNA-binding phage protein
MKKRSGEVDYYEVLLKDLQNPKEANAYLNAALQDEDPRVFLVVLKNVLEAQAKAGQLLLKRLILTASHFIVLFQNEGIQRLKVLSLF